MVVFLVHWCLIPPHQVDQAYQLHPMKCCFIAIVLEGADMPDLPGVVALMHVMVGQSLHATLL